MTYVVSLTRHVQKQLARLGSDYHGATAKSIAALGENPRPDGCAKMQGDYAGKYRIEVRGQIRVIYEIDDVQRTVLVTGIGNRGDVYKK